MARWWRRSVIRPAVALAIVAVVSTSAACSGAPAGNDPSATVSTSPSNPAPWPSAPNIPSEHMSASADPGAAASSEPGPTPRPSPPCPIPDTLRGRDLEVLPDVGKVVALTFDAGASDAGVDSILATLERERVPGTFFLTGDFVDSFPASSRAMARYPVGNHSYTHPELTTLGEEQVRGEIRRAAARIAEVTGQDPRPLFRFPYGAVNAGVIGIVNDECYVPFRWTVDTLGWQGVSGGRSVDSVVERTLANARPGEIVLLHVGAHPQDGSTLDADALPRIITGLRSQGYGFVTLDSVVR